jgi:hypothetical protein
MQTNLTDQPQAVQTEQQQALRTEYDQQKERRAALTNLTLRVTESQTPTPTQEENDLARLGLLHPDEKGPGAAPEMPTVAAQQEYLASGEGRMEPVERARDTARPQAPAAPPAHRPQPEQRPAERNVPRPPDSDKR